MTYDEGDFTFMGQDAEMLHDHWVAANELGLQPFFAVDSGPYIFSDAPELTTYSNHPLVDSKYGHSGASLALVCRHMQYIFRNGWEAYVKNQTNSSEDK